MNAVGGYLKALLLITFVCNGVGHLVQDRGHRSPPGLYVRLEEAAVPPWWRGGEVVGAQGNHGISSNLSEKGLGQYFPLKVLLGQ